MTGGRRLGAGWAWPGSVNDSRFCVLPENGSGQLYCFAISFCLTHLQEKRLPDKMVSHNWRNLFSHLMAALFADAAGKTSFRTVLSWMRLGSPGEASPSLVLSALLLCCRGWDLIEAEVQDAGQLDSSRWLCIFAVNQPGIPAAACSEPSLVGSMFWPMPLRDPGRHVSICDKTWGGKDSLLGRPYIPCGCRKETLRKQSNVFTLSTACLGTAEIVVSRRRKSTQAFSVR